MKQYEEVFFGLVRTSLWQTPLDVPKDFHDWSSVLKLARSQAMMGLVGDVILTNPDILSSLPDPVVQRLQEIPMNNMAMHTLLNNTLILVVTTLREHGIEPVLLKGQGVARYYPVPELRQCGDIDLYVGQENYEVAYEALKPVVTEIDEKSALNVGVHFHAKVGSVLLEIHRFTDVGMDLTKNLRYQKYAASGVTDNLVNIDFGGIVVKTPNDDFNVFYLFHHLWRHFIKEGVGFRQLTDLTCFLHTHHGKLDLDYLKRVLDEMDLMLPWQTFGCVIVDWLGLPAEEMPFYAPQLRGKAEKVVSKVLNEGNFGQQTSYVRVRKRSYLYEKLFSLKCHIQRTTSMVIIFPRHALYGFYYTMKAGLRRVFQDIF